MFLPIVPTGQLFLAQVVALLGTGLATVVLGLAYDLENIISPILLIVASSDMLFFGTLGGFAASAALVFSVTLPSPQPSEKRGIYERNTRGIRIYFKTPLLRGLLALNLVAAAAGARVIVNTIVLIRVHLGLGESEVAITLGFFLPEGHPHVKNGRTHAHPFGIDDEHTRWTSHL